MYTLSLAYVGAIPEFVGLWEGGLLLVLAFLFNIIPSTGMVLCLSISILHGVNSNYIL